MQSIFHSLKADALLFYAGVLQTERKTLKLGNRMEKSFKKLEELLLHLNYVLLKLMLLVKMRLACCLFVA